jgi:hypothetical protein
MKTTYTLIVVAALTVCLCACNKGGSDINPNDIVGKWYENKLNIKQQTIGTGAIADTTYLSNNFTVGDYFQFNSDATALISNDGTIFSVNGKSIANGSPTGGQLYFRSYSVKGSVLTLQVGFIPTCLGCSQPGPSTETLLQLDADNLVIQAPPDTVNNNITTTITYYTKGR